MTFEAFETKLRAAVDLKGRALFVRPKTTGAFINFYNLPEARFAEKRGGGAEAENNRIMFEIDAVAPGETARVRMLVSGLYWAARAVGKPEPKLRAKTATDDKIVAYLAAHLAKVIEEIPPNYTHGEAP